MTKIEEIGLQYFQDVNPAIRFAMEEYAEWYAKQALNIAANNAKIISRTFYQGEDVAYDIMIDRENTGQITDGDGVPYGVTVFDIDTTSIVNITLPEHI
jgi:hypothetical protein